MNFLAYLTGFPRDKPFPAPEAPGGYAVEVAYQLHM